MLAVIAAAAEARCQLLEEELRAVRAATQGFRVYGSLPAM